MSSSAAGGCNGRLLFPSPPRMARSTWLAMSYDLGEPPTSGPLAPEAPALCLPFNSFFYPHFGCISQRALVPLSSLAFLSGVTLALIIDSLILRCLLYEMSGGSGKTSSKYWSCAAIEQQCFLVSSVFDGSRGSNMTTNADRLFVCCLDTLLSASYLGMALALAMAPSIMPGLYSLVMSISFNSMNLWSLVSGSMQILLILIQRENGIESRHSLGWQLEAKRY